MKWEMKKLGDVCEKASSNIAQNKIENDEGNYPIYGASGFIKRVSFYHQPKPYIGIVKDGAGVGRIMLLEANTSVISTLQYLIPKNTVNLKYFYYFLLGMDFTKYVNGSTIPHIYFKDYKEEPFPYSQLIEQQRIVNILDEAFAALDQAKDNLQRNVQNAKDLFQSELNELFTRKGDDWVEKKLIEVSKINYGYTEKASFDVIGPKFLRITDIQEKGVEWETVPYCKCANSDLPKYQLATGDIVFARTGATTGKSYLVESPPLSVFASYLIRLKLLPNSNLLPELVYYFFQTKMYWDKINAGVSGSAQGGFNASKLGDLTFSYPKSKVMQEQLVSKFDALSAETQQLTKIYEQKLLYIESLKKSLLQKAFSGGL